MMENADCEPGILTSLSRVDSPTIANLIELLDLRDRAAGFIDSSITARYPNLPPVCAPVITATFRSAAPLRPDHSVAGLAGLLEALSRRPLPHLLVVQDLDPAPCGVVYGEMIVRSLRQFGCVGLITNGLGRDLHQVGALHFPCWTGGVVVSHAHLRIEAVDLPVQVGGLTLRSGDLLHADANGIVMIPATAASVVAAAIDDFLAAEQDFIDFTERGPAAFADWRKAWDRKAQAIAAVRRRMLDQHQQLLAAELTTAGQIRA